MFSSPTFLPRFPLFNVRGKGLIIQNIMFTLWLFNIAMENGQFIDGLPIKNGYFPRLTVLLNQKVIIQLEAGLAARPIPTLGGALRSCERWFINHSKYVNISTINHTHMLHGA